MRLYCKKLREKLFWLTLDSNKSIETKSKMLTERINLHRIFSNPILARVEAKFGQLPNDYSALKKLLEIANHEYKPNKLRLVARATKNNRTP